MVEDDPLKALRELAEAGEKVFGPEEKQRSLFEHHCRPGNWLAMGGWAALALSYFTHWPVWIIAVIVMAAGWGANEHEERKIRGRMRAEIAADR